MSDESDDVAWFPVDALPDAVPAGFPSRLLRARARAAVVLGPHPPAPVRP